MKKTRICCFTELWESGGIEAFLCGVLSGIDFERTEVDIVSARIGHSIFTAPLKDMGVRFLELSSNPRSPKNHALFAKLVKERKYDIIHFNLFQAFAFYYVHQAKTLGVKYRIVHAHGAGLRKSRLLPLKMHLHRLGIRLWKKDITAKLACSDEAAEFLFGERADEIINNGIDTKKFAYFEESRKKARKELGIDENAAVVGHVGRLSGQKNQKFLIDVHSRLVKTIPDVRLLLVGDGHLRDELAEYAKALGVSDSVILYGPSTDIPSLMSAMDVFAFPSTIEGFGIVAAEAQASGLPTVCSEIIPSSAYLTSLAECIPLERGADGWAKRIGELLANKAMRRSPTDEIVASGFDISNTIEQMKKYYQEEKKNEAEYV